MYRGICSTCHQPVTYVEDRTRRWVHDSGWEPWPAPRHEVTAPTSITRT